MKIKTKYDQIIVIDIESTCWQKRIPRGQRTEIIEIGITPIDTKTGNLLETRDIIVKPSHSKISEYCTNLTTLTQEQVDLGISFKDACSILTEEYMTRERVWASYGNYDINQFELQCERENVNYPFSGYHINVKMLFAVVHALPSQISMSEALKKLEVPLEGTHHRGNDDSHNIAKILTGLIYKNREALVHDEKHK